MKGIRLWIVIAALTGVVGSTGYCFGLEPKGDFDPADAPWLSKPKLSINAINEDGSSYLISSLPVISSDKISLNLSLGYNGDKTSSKPGVLTYGVQTTTKLGDKSNLTSMMYVSAPQNNSALSLDQNQKQPQHKSDHVSINNADVKVGSVNIKLGLQDIGRDFSGFKSLIDTGSVSADTAKQFEKEKGMKRTSISLNLAPSSTSKDASQKSFSMNKIEDKSGGIESESAKVYGKNYNISASHRSIDSGFNRMADLTDSEKGQFGKETGMERLGIGGSFKFGSASSSMSFSKVQDSKTGASVEKQNISLSGNRIKISANYQSIDSSFNRIMDLTDANKEQMLGDIGYKRWDITTGLQISNSLSWNSFYLTGSNDSAKRDRKQLRNQLAYNPKNGPKITAFRDQYSESSEETGNISNYLHELYTIDDELGGFRFNIHREKKESQSGNSDPVTMTINSEHIQSAKKSNNLSFVLDHQNVDYGDGRTEETRSYNITSTLLKGVTFTHSFVEIDRDKNRADEETSAFGLQYSISKNIQAYTNTSQKNASDGHTTDRVKYGLTGLLADNILFLGNTKLSMYSSTEKQDDATVKETESYKLDSKIAGGSFAFEQNTRRSTSVQAESRSLSFVSDRANKHLLFDFFYKDREDSPSAKYLIKSYNIGWKPNTRTELSYGHFANVEKDKTNVTEDGETYERSTVDPVSGNVIKLSNVVSKGLKLSLDYRIDENLVNGSEGRRYGLGLTGKLSCGQTIEIYYGFEGISSGASDSSVQTYRLKYEDQLNKDFQLAFSGSWRVGSGNIGNGISDLQARLDLQAKFN